MFYVLAFRQPAVVNYVMYALQGKLSFKIYL